MVLCSYLMMRLKKRQQKKFFEYLLSEEAYGDFLNAEPGLFLPVTETGAEYDSWRSNEVLSTYSEQVQTLLEASSTGALFGFTDGVCSDIGSITGSNLIAQTLQQMTVNGLSAEEAAEWGQKQWKKLPRQTNNIESINHNHRHRWWLWFK